MEDIRKLLTDDIDNLREVFKAARSRRSFTAKPSLFCPIACIASGF
jgi:hypothetical protein